MSENPYAIPVEELVASAQVAPDAQIELLTEPFPVTAPLAR